jgi:ubiquinone/menaquinone biosynthesis C-methylase UbiE
MTSIPQRGPYQGMLQIVRFNWSRYLAAAAIVGAAAFAALLVSSLGAVLLLVAALPALCWMVSSLLVSHYIYDRAHLYDLPWLARALQRSPRRWLSIHCGLDETSTLLAAQFPGASGEVVDIFDPRVMTESSIHRARAAQPGAVRSTPARFHALPFPTASFDAVFCIFAAHELRRHAYRVRLFTEIARILSPAGEFVLVEHLRDWPNFLAFGPGFLHFHSWRAWQHAASDAGLTSRTHFPFTSFLRVVTFRRTI